MDMVALWVASLPGAFGRVTSFGTGPLLFATAGLLVIGLLKTSLRWSGAAFAVLALVLAARTPVPDVLVAADGRTFAVRTASSLSIVPAATRSPPASGSPPTPTAATSTTRVSAKASRAIRSGVSGARRWANRVLRVRARRI